MNPSEYKHFQRILRLPFPSRCQELEFIIDNACLKELHDIFPALMQSIFGLSDGPGWHIRSITRMQTPVEFDVLYHFFTPIRGPMFRLLNRLMGKSFKFLLSFVHLPAKLKDKLLTSRCGFYYNFVSVDPFRQQIVGLMLSPLDYFLFHFAIHGTVPYRQMFPGGLPYILENERVKTLYFILSADYVCTFLPSDSQDVVCMHRHDIATLPPTTCMPIRSQTKAIKYLLPQRLHHHFPPDQLEAPTTDITRGSESIVYIFLDTWLGMNLGEGWELPSPELIWCLRVLVKQLHAFCNSSKKETSGAVVALRKAAWLILSARITDFLKHIFVRWPLDDSFIDVLELWLSFIQPWRYQHNRVLPILSIDPKFEAFITENLENYTQPCNQLIRRLLKSDLTTSRNTTLLFRLCKVFGQANLLELLRQLEWEKCAAKEPPPSVSWFDCSSNAGFNSAQSLSYTSPQIIGFGKNVCYVELFSEKSNQPLQKLLQKVNKATALTMKTMNEQQKLMPRSWIVKLYYSFVGEHGKEQKLRDLHDVLAHLNYAANTLEQRFSVSVDNHEEQKMTPESNASTGCTDDSILRPAVNWTDPTLQPIRRDEITFLVRFLHFVSLKLNFMFRNEIQRLWYNEGNWGKIARRMLTPPMTIFNKHRDDSKDVSNKELPPRICLRFLASYKIIFIGGCLFLLGQLMREAPSYGWMTLLFTVLLIRLLYQAYL